MNILSFKLSQYIFIVCFVKFMVAVKETEDVSSQSRELKDIGALLTFYLCQLYLNGQWNYWAILNHFEFIIIIVLLICDYNIEFMVYFIVKCVGFINLQQEVRQDKVWIGTLDIQSWVNSDIV